jgi:CBS domain containing-hemolysin-like protein
MESGMLLWVAIAAAICGSLATIAARSLRNFSRQELEDRCERRQQQALFSDILHHHDRIGLVIEMLGVALFTAAVGCASVWGWSYAEAEGDPAVWWRYASVLVIIACVVLVASVWIPWSMSRIAAASYLYHTWPLWKSIARIGFPVLWLARLADSIMHRVAGRPLTEADEETIEEEIRTIVSEGHREGLLEEDAREMIEGVIDLGDAVVSHIMTPRTEMHMVHVGMPWDELIDDLIDAGNTRVPVYDKNRDDVIGILHIKDLLPELAKGNGDARRPISALLRKPLFVPETKPVDELLQFFQKSRTHIAVVLDEYGGVSGLVTIEDVLEEIVGEIADEYDKETEDEIRKIDDDNCEALGRAHVDEINDLMGFELPETEDFDTIGGFVFAELGRVPAVGETLTWKDSVRVTVLDASRRRVNRVRLERIRQESLEIA